MSKGYVKHELGTANHEAAAHVMNSKGEVIKTYKRRHYGKDYKDMADDHASLVNEGNAANKEKKNLVTAKVGANTTGYSKEMAYLDRKNGSGSEAYNSKQAVDRLKKAGRRALKRTNEPRRLAEVLAEMKRSRGRPKKKRDMQGNVIDDDDSNQ